MAKIKNKNLRVFLSYLMLTIGCIIAAMALETFLIPNTILDGGVTGISIIISKLTKIPLSFLVLILNKFIPSDILALISENNFFINYPSNSKNTFSKDSSPFISSMLPTFTSSPFLIIPTLEHSFSATSSM